MKDLVVQRYNIVTVHSNGETFDDLREKPNGMICYYREANESHKEILAEHGESVNESLLKALQELVFLYEHDEGCRELTEYRRAKIAISKALGDE